MGAVSVKAMLARSAHGLFWMSRYLERAEHTARLLTAQFDALEDRTVEEIDQNWARIYLSIGRSPIGGELSENFGDEDFMLMDSFTLADDLTFELANVDSIRSSMHYARENARQIRNVIGRQLWTRLNTAYLELRNSGIEIVWDRQPRNFYLNVEDSIRTLSGILDSTAYRDHGWHFLQLGRYIERTQIVAALLDAHIQVFPTTQKHVASDWNSLLFICDAQLAYRRRHSLLALDPLRVLNFLICDASLSHSIQYSLERSLEHLNLVSSERNDPKITHINQNLKVVLQLIGDDWHSSFQIDEDVRSILQNVLESSRRISDEIASAYFDFGLNR